VDDDVQRRAKIHDRIVAIREELDQLLRELGAPESGIEEAEQRRARFTIIKGGLALAGPGALAAWASRHARGIAAAAVGAGAVAVIAGALLAHGPSARIPHGAPGPAPQPSATAPARPGAPSPSSTVVPKPPGRPPVPPPVLIVPVRSRRPSASASAAPAGAPTPPPTPASSPSRTARPSARCTAGLALRLLAISATACV
jgi:hypothetical protein